MYKIFADDTTLIYDSTIEKYKIGKGQITLETNKSGSFVFSVYPDHFYYDKFIRRKTVITVYRSGKIVFRGRVLNDKTDYWNNKEITCEGELGFLQDSIIRPYDFKGTPEALFKKFINEHNSQVDEDKQFKIGTVSVVDSNGNIARLNTAYESAFINLKDRLIEETLGGYLYITHGSNGDDVIPTINYLADFTKVASQKIEFGSNLKNYTKTVKASDIATAIIPLGAKIDDGNSDTEDPRLTIASVNSGKDYIYDADAVALYGWIYKVVEWDDVTEPANLKSKAQKYLESIVKQNITIELNVIDLHLIDPNIESFNVNDYIRAVSEPHNFDLTLLCTKQTLNLLKPDNDTVVLGYNYLTFTETSGKISTTISRLPNIQAGLNNVAGKVITLNTTVTNVDNFQKGIADYIIEVGTTNGWTWEKWNSGKYVCRGIFYESRTNYITINNFYGYHSNDFPYPFEFINTPTVIFNCRLGTGFSIPAGDVQQSKTHARCYGLGTDSGTVDCVWEIVAIGKWV